MFKLLRLTTVPVSLKILLRGQLGFMRQYFIVKGISSSGPELEQVEAQEDIETIPVEMARDISILNDLKALWNLILLFRKEKPEIVHTHTPKAGTLGMVAAWVCRVPVRLHTVAGLPLMEARGAKREVLNIVERITYSLATKVYPNSYGLQEVIIQNGFCKASKLKVIGNGSSNGINTEYFTPDAVTSEQKLGLCDELGIQSNDFVFIFIGRLVTDKGINELVKAFQEVQAKHPLCKLLLVGNAEPELDPLLPETEKAIATHESIITTGFQSDVRPYLSISHALVFPSYREGFPNVPMQAGAMGLPSIVTDINGCNEIVHHEYNGLIIPPKNTEALVYAMLRLVEDPGLTQRVADNARESIVSRFDQQTLWKLIKEEYDEQLRIKGLINSDDLE
ncbi:glycosyltransferase [Bacteroidales bacterium 6E]|nr:glycosyltransferase [Bacteroidales bacterium 6E]